MLTALLYWMGALIIVNVLGVLARRFQAEADRQGFGKSVRLFRGVMSMLELLLFIIFIAGLVGIGASYYFAAL